MCTGDLFDQHQLMMRQAIENHDLDRVQMLLKTDYINVNGYVTGNEQSERPLTHSFSHARWIHHAIKYGYSGDFEIIKALLDAGANPKLQVDDVYWMSAVGYLMSIRTAMDLLIYFPTFLDMESGPESLSTLFMPKGPGNHFTDPIGLIKKLIRLGADVNFTPEPVNKIVSTFSALAMVKRWQVNFISHQQQQDTISFLEGIGAKEIIRQGN